MATTQKPNVDVRFTTVEKMAENNITVFDVLGGDADTVMCVQRVSA